MLKLQFVFTFCMVCLQVFSQQPKKIAILIDEYSYSFTPQNVGCKTKFSDTLDDGRRIDVRLNSCKGELDILVSKGGKRIEQGHYSNSLDLLKKYINSINGISGKTNIRVYAYYRPLRDGKWLFYDPNGKKIIKKILYKRGIEMK